MTVILLTYGDQKNTLLYKCDWFQWIGEKIDCQSVVMSSFYFIRNIFLNVLHFGGGRLFYFF